MKKFFKWIKEHVRPYIKMREKEELSEVGKKDKEPQDFKERLENVEKNAEVGIKINFKF